MRKAALLLLGIFIVFGGKLSAQLTGFKFIPGDYPTLAAAITDLNTVGVGPGGVIFFHMASETAPAGGYQITATGTATDPIVFTGNGNTITASPSHTVGALNDAIFKIIGSDFVGIQGYVMQENPANVVSTPTASNTMTEWGVALLYASATDGAQSNVIMGNTISLNRTYTNTFGIYSNTRHTATSIATAADITAVSGSNSNNTIVQNTISNVNMGITFIGSNNGTFQDQGNVIGTPTMGNIITNWGGAAATSSYVSNSGTSYCILMNHQRNSIVRGNTISTTASPTVTFRGIVQEYTATPPTASANNQICQNTITMSSSQASGGFQAITVANGSSMETMTIDSNLIQNMALTGAGTSSTLAGIAVANAMGALNIRTNRVLDNTSTATTGGFAGITVSSAMTGSCDISDNRIGNASNDAITFSAANSGTVLGISFTGSGAAASINISDNIFHGFVFSVTSTSVVDIIRHTGVIGTSTINNNTFDNIALNTSGAISMINNSMAGGPASTVLISGNVISGSFSKTATGGSLLYLVNGSGSSAVGAARTVQNNIFSNVSAVNTGIIGINETGGASNGAVNRQVIGNTMNNWSTTAAMIMIDFNRGAAGSVISNNSIATMNSGAGGMYGISVGPNCGTGLGVYSNSVSALSGTGFVTLINVAASAFTAGIEIAGNVLSGATSTSTTFSVTGIANASSGPNNIHHNTIFDLNSVAPSPFGAFGFSGAFSGAASTLHNNKIYDLENTNVNGLASGITITSTIDVSAYNNIIGDIRTPNSTADATARGIDIQSTGGTCNLDYNTVYLAGTSAGSGFGSTCLNVNTGCSFTMRNNLFVNLSTPTGGGLAVAYTRSSTSLANFQSQSNYNAFYAGTPSASNLIFFDGTNADQTLAAYQTRVAPLREVNSVTENPVFSSIVGSDPDFLHIPAATTSLLESGGVVVGGITVDWDGDARPGPAGSVNGGALAPDIGADEFDGILASCSGTPTAGTASTTSPPAQCEGSTFDLELNGHSTGAPFTYQWQEATVSGGPYTNISGATSDTYTTAALSTTMYYVCVVTCTVSGLSATSTEVTCTINPNPVITFLPVAPELCDGGMVNIVASGANTYSWNPATGLSSSTINNPDASPAATTTYTVTGTDVNGCVGTATITVTVNPLPTVNATADIDPLCAGSTVTLDATGADTYFWDPISASGSSVTDTPASSTTYTVTGTDVNGCTNTAMVSVTVLPAPTVSASADFTTVCEGSPVTLTGNGASTYEWNPGAISGSPVVVNPLASTTYTVTGTDVNGCTATDMVTITVNPAPVVTASTTSGTICEGSSATLDAFGALTYDWQPGSLSGSSVSVSPTSTTTYTVTGTDGNGCTATDMVTVTVNPAPVLTANATPAAICEGETTTLDATGASTYLWMPGSLSGASVIDAPVTTTTYTVTGTDVNGCTNTETVTVTVNPLPVVNASATPSTICEGSSTTLDATGASTYLWMPGSLSGASVSDAPVSTTTYTVTGTDVNGCTSTANTTVTVDPAPSVGASATATTICEGSFTMLTGSGADTYTWMPGSLSGTNVVVSPSATTTYTVTGTDLSGCTNTATITIIVQPLPVVSITGAPAYCQGDSTTLTASAGATWQWYLNGVQIPGAVLQTYDASVPGSYNVVVALPSGCADSAATGHTLIENPSPTVSFTASPGLTVCEGTAITLSGTGAPSYSWSGGITDGVAFTPLVSGSYTVTGTDGNGCTGTDVAVVTVNPLPTVSASASPAAAVCAGSSVTLSGSGATSYAWTGGVTDGVPFIPPSTTTYTVTGTDLNGCTATDVMTVTVNPAPTVSFSASPGTTVCSGTAVTLSGTGASSYAWTGGVVDGVAFTPAVTTTYTVTGTDGNGCTASATATITVNPNPTVSFTASPSTTVCAGTAVTLSGIGATSYAWTGGVTDGVPFTPVATTTYTVTGTDGAGCTATAMVTITVNPAPTVGSTATPSASVCAGSPVTLNGTGATSYTWSGGVTDGISFVPPATATYTVTGTDGNGCTATSTILVTVNPAPTVGATATPGTSICTGSSVTLNGTGAVSYTWSGGVSDGVAFVPPSTASYVVTGTDGNGCTNTSTITITVNPLPTVSASVSPASTVCQGTMVTLTGNGASSYAWTGGVTDGVPFAASVTTTYTVTGTDANGCTGTAMQTITVNPAPSVTANASPGTTVCSGSMVTLTGSGASSYAWTGGVVDGVPFAAAATTTYTVTGTDGIGCSNTATITITVNPQPSISSTVSPGSTVCAGTSVTLNGTGGVSYTWSGGVTDGVPFTASTTTTYTVTGTDGNGCTNTATTTITVNPAPTITSAASPSSTVCEGTMVTLNGFGGSSYTWSGGVTDGVPFAATTTTTYTVTGTDGNGCTGTSTITITVDPAPNINAVQSPAGPVCAGNSVTLNGIGGIAYTWTGGVTNGVSFVPLATTTYTVTGTGFNGCTNTATITVTVNPLPTVSSTAAPATTVCSGTSVTLSGTGASTYSWSGGVTNNVPFTPASTTTYTVTGTDANGCTNTATTTITVNPTPVISYNATPGTSVCAGSSVTLSGTGADSYTWTGGVTDNVAFTPVATGTYTVTGTAANGCTSTATATITVNPLPTVGTTTNPSTLVCSGTMVTLAGSGAATYVWTGGVTDNVPFSASTTTTYTVTGTDANGCTNTAVTTVTVNPTPTVSFVATPGVNICYGTELTLDGAGAVTYSWSDPMVMDGNPFTPLVSDTFVVVGTDGNGCMDSATAIITVNAPPVITAMVTPSDTVCENTMITLSGLGAATYAWSHGVTNNVPFAATTTTTYTVVGTDGNGCMDTTTQTIEVVPGPGVSITGNSTFCTGGSTTLTSSAGTTYQWFMNGSPIAGATASSYVATAAGVYNVWVTNAAGCSDSSATGMNVTINTPPVVNANATATTVCRGTSVTLTGSGATSYAWSGGVNNGIPFTPLNTLTYTVVGTASNGCTATDTITVVVNSVPFVGTSASPGFNVCENTAVTLNGLGAATYSWTGGVIDGVPFTPLTTASYTVTGTDMNGCTNTASVTVTVNTLPVVDLGPDSTQCGSIALDAGNAGSTYLWNTTDTTQMITATASGTYIVEVTNAAGCTSSDTVVLTINTQPVVALGADDTLCADSITLDAMNPGATYSWNDMSTGQTIVVTSSGTYFVTATMPGGCTSSDTVNLVLHAPPVVTLSLALDTACLNMGAVMLSGESPAGGTWSGPAVSGNSFDPMIAGVGTFGITYMYTDTNGCSGMATDSMLVDPCLGLEQPVAAALDFNAFPNPNNGEFTITISGASAATVMIYDAAGQLVKTDRALQGEVLNVSIEASGMYMVTVVTDEGQQVVKRILVNR